MPNTATAAMGIRGRGRVRIIKWRLGSPTLADTSPWLGVIDQRPDRSPVNAGPRLAEMALRVAGTPHKSRPSYLSGAQATWIRHSIRRKTYLPALSPVS